MCSKHFRVIRYLSTYHNRSIQPGLLSSHFTTPSSSYACKEQAKKPYAIFINTSSFSRSSTYRRDMADDTSYSTFLTKANADPKSGITADDHNPHAATEQDAKIQSTSQARSKYDPSTGNAGVPQPLQNLPNVQYVSDTDSDFRPVFFNYGSDSLPSISDFEQILAKKGQQDAEIEELSESDFDPRGEYLAIVEKVKEVGSGSDKAGGNAGITIFRVQRHGARVDYYVLTVGEGKLVGVVTEAVES